METKETIIYRLAMRNDDFDAYLKRENGCGRHAGAEGSGALRPDLKVAHWLDLFVKPLYRKHIFLILGPEPPPPLKRFEDTFLHVKTYVIPWLTVLSTWPLANSVLFKYHLKYAQCIYLTVLCVEDPLLATATAQ